MKIQWFGILVVFILLAAPVTAQLYDNKHDAMVSPMDDAAAKAGVDPAAIGIAGDKEDAMTQEDRYQMMTNGMNEANEKHFQAFENTER